MTFTDDDLKRVKKACSQLHGPVGINGAYVLPLIARLEAAEKLVGKEHTCGVGDYQTFCDCLFGKAYKAWRKVCGK